MLSPGKSTSEFKLTIGVILTTAITAAGVFLDQEHLQEWLIAAKANQWITGAAAVYVLGRVILKAIQLWRGGQEISFDSLGVIDIASQIEQTRGQVIAQLQQAIEDARKQTMKNDDLIRSLEEQLTRLINPQSTDATQ